MKSVIKRGLALTAIASASCAAGLLTPAPAAAGDPPRYILESLSNPGTVLTSLPCGPISVGPRGATPGRSGSRHPRRGGTVRGRPGPGLAPAQRGGDIVRFESFVGCLSGEYGRVYAGDCRAYTARWRLVLVP